MHIDNSNKTVWCILTHTLGNNLQAKTLASQLNTNVIFKKFVFNVPLALICLLDFIPLGASRLSIKKNLSDTYSPPWPDLIILADKLAEDIVLWIKKQSNNHTKLVFLGRPYSNSEYWDLIIPTPQYSLPHKNNIYPISFPLHNVSKQKLNDEVNKWQHTFSSLKGPYISVLLGGHTAQFAFTRARGIMLGKKLNLLAVEIGASLLITSSRRTPHQFIEALLSELKVEYYIYRWEKNTAELQNPYYAILGLADLHIVTGDSTSLIAEACATNKPVHVFFPLKENYSDILAKIFSKAYKLKNIIQPRYKHFDFTNYHKHLSNRNQIVMINKIIDKNQMCDAPDNQSIVLNELKDRILLLLQ